jgi:hypothetical protein
LPLTNNHFCVSSSSLTCKALPIFWSNRSQQITQDIFYPWHTGHNASPYKIFIFLFEITHKLLYTMMASDYNTTSTSVLFTQHLHFLSERRHVPLLLSLGSSPTCASPFQDKIKKEVTLISKNFRKYYWSTFHYCRISM